MDHEQEMRNTRAKHEQEMQKLKDAEKLQQERITADLRRTKQECDTKLNSAFKKFEDAVNQSASNPSYQKHELMKAWKIARLANQDCTAIEQKLRGLGCKESFISNLDKVIDVL
jgi:hypothetical protein